ncbi:NADH:ubiquinone oxidoreductase intermediate-associated protein 30, partial [Protomyces lactucae-debilis]
HWLAGDWKAVDDTVRQGASSSQLAIAEDSSTARFQGVLDTSKLGGAGFASQAATYKTSPWDLSQYDGIEIVYSNGNSFNYTLNMKDYLPEQPIGGRMPSSTEWAFTFEVKKPASHSISKSPETTTIFAAWEDFAPYERGRPTTTTSELKKDHIVQFSIMARSFFDRQSGPFGITLHSISA